MCWVLKVAPFTDVVCWWWCFQAIGEVGLCNNVVLRRRSGLSTQMCRLLRKLRRCDDLVGWDWFVNTKTMYNCGVSHHCSGLEFRTGVALEGSGQYMGTLVKIIGVSILFDHRDLQRWLVLYVWVSTVLWCSFRSRSTSVRIFNLEVVSHEFPS